MLLLLREGSTFEDTVNELPILCDPRTDTIAILGRSASITVALRHGLPVEARLGRTMIRARNGSILITPRNGRCC